MWHETFGCFTKLNIPEIEIQINEVNRAFGIIFEVLLWIYYGSIIQRSCHICNGGLRASILRIYSAMRG